MTDDYVSDLRAFCTEWLKQNAGCDLIDHGFGAEHGGELTTGKLGAVLDELEQLRTERGKLFRVVGAVECAYGLNTYVELEPGEAQPTIESLRAGVREIMDADAAPQQPECMDGGQ